MGHKATKIKHLTDKILTHAMNAELPHTLYFEPSLGPELLDVLAQAIELNISQHARTMMTMFEEVLVPMLRMSNS